MFPISTGDVFEGVVVDLGATEEKALRGVGFDVAAGDGEFAENDDNNGDST